MKLETLSGPVTIVSFSRVPRRAVHILPRGAHVASRPWLSTTRASGPNHRCWRTPSIAAPSPTLVRRQPDPRLPEPATANANGRSRASGLSGADASIHGDARARRHDQSDSQRMALVARRGPGTHGERGRFCPTAGAGCQLCAMAPPNSCRAARVGLPRISFGADHELIGAGVHDHGHQLPAADSDPRNQETYRPRPERA
jgi:hypothetical protein